MAADPLAAARRILKNAERPEFSIAVDRKIMWWGDRKRQTCGVELIPTGPRPPRRNTKGR